jgi:hypothetical protein
LLCKATPVWQRAGHKRAASRRLIINLLLRHGVADVQSQTRLNTVRERAVVASRFPTIGKNRPALACHQLSTGGQNRSCMMPPFEIGHMTKTDRNRCRSVGASTYDFELHCIEQQINFGGRQGLESLDFVFHSPRAKRLRAKRKYDCEKAPKDGRACRTWRKTKSRQLYNSKAERPPYPGWRVETQSKLLAWKLVNGADSHSLKRSM